MASCHICGKPVRARELCAGHYQRWAKHGDPLWTHPARGVDPAQRFQLHVAAATSPDECSLWTAYTDKRGYGMFSTGSRAEGTFKNRGAHVFALEQALGRPLSSGMYALHTCDNPSCVRNDGEGTYEINGVLRLRRGHLWEGTNQDNTADRTAKGRSASGPRNGVYLHPESYPAGEDQWLAKLTKEQVLAIRRQATEGVRQADLAVQYGVGKTNIHKIVHRQSWKHVL